MGKFYGYATDGQGNPTKRIIADEYDCRKDRWYADAIKQKKPLWSKIYNWDDNPSMISVSASYPLYKPDKSLIGVIGIDLILSYIQDYLRQLKLSPNAKIWIVEGDGMLHFISPRNAVAICIIYTLLSRIILDVYSVSLSR